MTATEIAYKKYHIRTIEHVEIEAILTYTRTRITQLTTN